MGQDEKELVQDEERRKTPAWQGVGFLALVQKQLALNRPCLCSSQQSCLDWHQLQLPEDYPELSFCQFELVEVGELVDWKDVFPQVSPVPVQASFGQLVFAPAEEWPAFSALLEF